MAAGTDDEEDEGERAFKLLKDRIFKNTKLDCHQYKTKYLKRRISVRMRAHDCRSYTEYHRLLRKNPSEYRELLENLTINVTHFFRDPTVFALLADEVLPLIIYHKVKANRRVIRLWSAGCASGEEPYSLALIIRDLLGEEFEHFIVTVVATDIDETSLARARRGNYQPAQLANVPPELLDRYFLFDGTDYHVNEEIKDLVRFRVRDLFRHRTGAHFDLIVCRNVIIYFSKKMQERLFRQFFQALNAGGYLVIGKTETLVGAGKQQFLIHNGRERIYRKPPRRKGK